MQLGFDVGINGCEIIKSKVKIQKVKVYLKEILRHCLGIFLFIIILYFYQ